jgi:hypothetical protein
VTVRVIDSDDRQSARAGTSAIRPTGHGGLGTSTACWSPAPWHHPNPNVETNGGPQLLPVMSDLAISSGMYPWDPRYRPTETTIETASLGQDVGHQRLG